MAGLRVCNKMQPWLLSLRYKPDRDNAVADALSRQEWRPQRPREMTEIANETGCSLSAGGDRGSCFSAEGCEGSALTGVEKKIEERGLHEKRAGMTL